MSEYTEWFPAHIKPVRNGVYEVDTPNCHANKYAYFDRHGWRLCSSTIEEANDQKTDLEDLDESSMTLKTSQWRGLAKKP